jgi:hypothetical protein
MEELSGLFDLACCVRPFVRLYRRLSVGNYPLEYLFHEKGKKSRINPIETHSAIDAALPTSNCTPLVS